MAQRQVFDGIQSSGGISEIVITLSLMSYVRSSHSRYSDALKRKREAQSEEETKRVQKREATQKIKELKAKRSELTAELQTETRDIQKEIERLDKFSKS